MQRIGILAGELSGDALGAELMAALRQRYPDVVFEGVGGPRMTREGLESLYPISRLSVMGISEVVAHLPGLLKMRKALARHFLRNPPDCFIGIDAPDFNLALERQLRAGGIPTVHYVSPSVWAWRESRMKRIAESVDLMLTLFPFEVAVYERHGVPVEWVGHPAADRFPVEPDRAGYRQSLGIGEDEQVLALLPGSRVTEVERLGGVYAETVRRLAQANPKLRFVAAMATPEVESRFVGALQRVGVGERVQRINGHADDVMGAADVALIASGTATLEAMLVKTPMVVTYKMAPLTVAVMKYFRMLKISRFALPNLLAGEDVVEEYMQDASSANNLVPALQRLLDDPERRERMRERFVALHQELRQGAAQWAADAIVRLSPR